MSKNENEKIKNELLKSCRYYKGEPSAPKGIHILFWIAEEAAVRRVESGRDIDELLSGYKAIGEPGKASGVHPLILDSLFTLYCKGSNTAPWDNIESFEKNHLPRYMASTSM